MIDSVPGAWLAPMAYIAGSEDIDGFLEALAALLEVAVPHDASILACQLTAAAFEAGARSHNPTIVDAAEGMTAQALVGSLPFASSTFDIAPEIRARLASPDWTHAVTMVIPCHDDIGATAILYRTMAQGPFDAEALATLESLRPICARALERVIDQQKLHAHNQALLGFLRDLPVGVIMLDWDWRIVFVNREGYRQAMHWRYAPGTPPRNADPREEFVIPDAVFAACNIFRNRHLAERTGSVSDEPATITMQHATRPDLKVSITASRALDDPTEPAKFLIRFYGMATRTEPGFEPTSDQLKLLAQLTSTERSIALLVRQGLSNREIAEMLHREVSTIKDHLTHVFDKLAIRSRVQLARMLSR